MHDRRLSCHRATSSEGQSHNTLSQNCDRNEPAVRPAVQFVNVNFNGSDADFKPYQERRKEENGRQHGYATSFSGQTWTWKEH